MACVQDSITPHLLMIFMRRKIFIDAHRVAWLWISQKALRWGIWRRERSKKKTKLIVSMNFFFLICSKVFGDLFSPTSECYPYNNYKSLMSIENDLGVVGRMSIRQRRRKQRQSRLRGPSCPEWHFPYRRHQPQQ